MLLSSLCLSARDFIYEGIAYTVLDENEKTVQTKAGSVETDPNDESKEIHIPGNTVSILIQLPEKVTDENGNEYTLTTIGKDSFCENSTLLSVSLPESVKEIEDNAFYGCNYLIKINFPEGLKSIGNYAFFACISLMDIELPAGLLMIKTGSFAGCALKSINLPENLMAIYEYAFMSCMNLTEVRIPENVFLMGDACFLGCTSLKTLYLPAKLLFAGSMMFYSCKELTSVYYPTDSPVSASKNNFDNSIYSSATLYVQAGASSAMAQTIPWKYFSNIVEYDFSSIDAIQTESPNQPVEYYDLNGRRVQSPIPGQLLIRRVGTETSKIFF